MTFASRRALLHNRPTMPDDPPPEPAAAGENPSSRLRLARGRIVVLLVLLGICYAVNGPLARWLVIYGLNKGLESQGMSGGAQVSGTLSQGFVIRGLSYTGDQGIRSLEVAELAAHYRFSELFSGKVRRVDLSKGKVVLDLDQFPESDERDGEEESKLKETLETLHPWITRPEITLSQLEVTLLKSGQQEARFTLASFTHQAGAETFDVVGFTAADRAGRSTPEQNVRLVWRPEAASIDRLELLPDIALEEVTLDWAEDFRGAGVLKWGDASLSVSVADSITARLTGGTIDSKSLNKRFDLGIPGAFSVAAIDLAVENWRQPIPRWQVRAAVDLAAAEYRDYRLADTRIRIAQKELDYQLAVKGTLNRSPLEVEATGKWLSADAEQWWGHTTANYRIKVPKLGPLTRLLGGLPDGLKLAGASVEAAGSIAVEDSAVLRADTRGRLAGVLAGKSALPALDLTADYQSSGACRAEVTASRGSTTVLELDADYNTANSDYRGALKISDTEPAWINALAKVFNAEVKLDGPAELTWSGHGNAAGFSDPKLRQQGLLRIKKLRIKLPDTPALEIAAEADYNWPETVRLTSLAVRGNDWLGTAALAWDGGVIDITRLDLQENGRPLATLSGKVPYRTEIDEIGKFFNQTAPWSLSLKTQPLALAKLREWFSTDSLSELTGTAELELDLGGSPKRPRVTGKARASNVKGVDDAGLQPLHAALNFRSEREKLLVKGNLLEGQSERLSLSGALPFNPADWVDDPAFIDRFITSAPLSAEVKINTLPLERLKNFVPQLERISGTINGSAKLGGTLGDPRYTIDLAADVPLLRLKKSDLGDIRDIKLKTRFSENRKATAQLTAQINGGKFKAGGTVDLADFNKPVLDLYLRTQYALVYRDDLLSMRANSDLKLTGGLEDATISGTIGIAESLFYKDIELIPIGVPSSEVAKVKLPSLSKKKAAGKLPVPEPFARWKLDLTVRTDDPILIRGNVAAGNLSGALKVGGTLAQPAPRGTVLANRVKAKLPFSILTIERGEIKFSPERGLDPVLNVRGKSTVGAHDVSVFVYGSASSPKTSFTSYPPLPESEVMALLATGTTTAGLENRSVATFKAFQVFLLKLQQRNDKPGGNKLFKALLSGIDELNLSVGETDPFTGRKFSSATVEVHPRWHLTAQVDDQQQTRGLIVYVIRFR